MDEVDVASVLVPYRLPTVSGPANVAGHTKPN